MRGGAYVGRPRAPPASSGGVVVRPSCAPPSPTLRTRGRDVAHVLTDHTGGGSGIRTHGELPHTRFPSVPIRPLSHPSRGHDGTRRRVASPVDRAKRGARGALYPKPT